MKDFSTVPEDEETIIIRQEEIKIDDLPALFQEWQWDSIRAQSIIFRDEDVLEYDDEQLFQKIWESKAVVVEKKHTLKRNCSGFTFVNVNFRETDDFF